MSNGNSQNFKMNTLSQTMKSSMKNKKIINSYPTKSSKFSNNNFKRSYIKNSINENQSDQHSEPARTVLFNENSFRNIDKRNFNHNFLIEKSKKNIIEEKNRNFLLNHINEANKKTIERRCILEDLIHKNEKKKISFSINDGKSTYSSSSKSSSNKCAKRIFSEGNLHKEIETKSSNLMKSNLNNINFKDLLKYRRKRKSNSILKISKSKIENEIQSRENSDLDKFGARKEKDIDFEAEDQENEKKKIKEAIKSLDKWDRDNLNKNETEIKKRIDNEISSKVRDFSKLHFMNEIKNDFSLGKNNGIKCIKEIFDKEEKDEIYILFQNIKIFKKNFNFEIFGKNSNNNMNHLPNNYYNTESEFKTEENIKKKFEMTKKGIFKGDLESINTEINNFQYDSRGYTSQNKNRILFYFTKDRMNNVKKKEKRIDSECRSDKSRNSSIRKYSDISKENSSSSKNLCLIIKEKNNIEQINKNANLLKNSLTAIKPSIGNLNIHEIKTLKFTNKFDNPPKTSKGNMMNLKIEDTIKNSKIPNIINGMSTDIFSNSKGLEKLSSLNSSQTISSNLQAIANGCNINQKKSMIKSNSKKNISEYLITNHTDRHNDTFKKNKLEDCNFFSYFNIKDKINFENYSDTDYYKKIIREKTRNENTFRKELMSTTQIICEKKIFKKRVHRIKLELIQKNNDLKNNLENLKNELECEKLKIHNLKSIANATLLNIGKYSQNTNSSNNSSSPIKKQSSSKYSLNSIGQLKNKKIKSNFPEEDLYFSSKSKFLYDIQIKDEELEKAKKEFFDMDKIYERNISKIDPQLNIIKKEINILKSNILHLYNQQKKYYLEILGKGIDVRNEGITWVIKRLIELNTPLNYSLFPRFLDESNVNYLMNISFKSIEITQLKIILKALKSRNSKSGEQGKDLMENNIKLNYEDFKNKFLMQLMNETLPEKNIKRLQRKCSIICSNRYDINKINLTLLENEEKENGYSFKNFQEWKDTKKIRKTLNMNNSKNRLLLDENLSDKPQEIGKSLKVSNLISNIVSKEKNIINDLNTNLNNKGNILNKSSQKLNLEPNFMIESKLINLKNQSNIHSIKTFKNDDLTNKEKNKTSILENKEFSVKEKKIKNIYRIPTILPMSPSFMINIDPNSSDHYYKIFSEKAIKIFEGILDKFRLFTKKNDDLKLIDEEITYIVKELREKLKARDLESLFVIFFLI